MDALIRPWDNLSAPRVITALAGAAILALAAAVGVGLVLAPRTPSPSRGEVSTGNGSNWSSFAPCTKLALGDAVRAAGRDEGSVAELVNGGFSCSKGWAVVMASLGTGGIPYATSTFSTFVFHSKHGIWRRQLDRAQLCDAHEVPQAIYGSACQTN